MAFTNMSRNSLMAFRTTINSLYSLISKSCSIQALLLVGLAMFFLVKHMLI